jgi:hypothetical protein
MQLSTYSEKWPQRSGPFTVKNLVIMNLTIILLLSACLTAGARDYSQSISLSLKNASLEKVFKEIGKQSGYDYVISNTIEADKISITININGADLQTTLDRCLAGLPVTYSIFDEMIVVKAKAVIRPEDQANEELYVNLQALLVNENGEPVPQLKIKKIARDYATATDAEGCFVLKGVRRNVLLDVTGITINQQVLYGFSGQENDIDQFVIKGASSPPQSTLHIILISIIVTINLVLLRRTKTVMIGFGLPFFIKIEFA